MKELDFLSLSGVADVVQSIREFKELLVLQARNENLEGFDEHKWRECIEREYMIFQEANLILIHDLTIIFKFWNVLHNFNTERKCIGFQRKHIGHSLYCNVNLDIYQRAHLNKPIDKEEEIQIVFLRHGFNKNIDKFEPTKESTSTDITKDGTNAVISNIVKVILTELKPVLRKN